MRINPNNEMKTIASISYQIKELKTSTLIFYPLMILLSTLGIISAATLSSGDHTMTISGFGFSTILFAFVMSMNSFKENLGFHLQNGISRATLFKARLLTTLAFSAFLALTDFFIQLIMHLFEGTISGFKSHSIIDYFLLLMPQVKMDYFPSQILGLAFSFCIFLGLSGLGYFLTVLFYRIGKLGKIIIGAGLPAIFILALPIADTIFNLNIMDSMLNALIFLMGITTGNLLIPHITFLALFAITSTGAWLIIRRTAIR